MDELEQYSLVTPVTHFTDTTLRLHPLVHAFAHDRLDPRSRTLYWAAAVRLLVCGSGEENQDLYEALSPHLKVLLDQRGPINANDLGGIANILYYEGKIEEATSIWEDIRNKAIAKYGEDNLRSSEATLQLAKMYWERVDRRIEARIWEDRVVGLRMELLSRDNPLTARAMSQRARGLEYRNLLSEAEDVRLEVLRILEKHFGSDSEEVLLEKENLAQTYRYRQKWSDAQNLWAEIWQARVAINGEKHWRTLKAMESLANLYDVVGGEGASLAHTEVDGKHGKVAEKLWQDVIAARTKMKGPLHPDTLYAQQSLAWCYEVQRRDAEAEAQWNEVLLLREKVQGSSHEATWQAMNALAFFDHKNGRDKQAEVRWRMTIDASESQGVVSRQSSKAMESLAKLFKKQGREKEASHLHAKISSLTPSRDRDIHSRYHKALNMLLQTRNEGPDTQVHGNKFNGPRPGMLTQHSNQSNGSMYSQMIKSYSGPPTAGSHGEAHFLAHASELLAGQHSVGQMTDSPSYIRNLRSAWRSPEVPNTGSALRTTPEKSSNTSRRETDIITVSLPTVIVGDIDASLVSLFEAVENQSDVVEQWKDDRAEISERLLSPIHGGNPDNEGLRAPHVTPALVRDESLPQVSDVVLVPVQTTPETDVQSNDNLYASCFQPCVTSVGYLVDRFKGALVGGE